MRRGNVFTQPDPGQGGGERDTEGQNDEGSPTLHQENVQLLS